jgi:hypothetical protein
VEKNQQPTTSNNQQTALQWLKDSLRGINRNQKGKLSDYRDILLNKDRNLKRRLLGQVVLFNYRPSSRVKFYDKYPLVIITDVSGTGFSGINLHYIPPVDRIRMILLMGSMVFNRKETDIQKIRVKILSLLNKKIFAKYYGTVFNNYTTKNILGKPKITIPEEWTHFAFLPVFKGINPSQLYSEILKEVNN